MTAKKQEQKPEEKQEQKPSKVKAVVIGKLKRDGKIVDVGSQVDVELVGGELPASLVNKVKLTK